MVINGAIYLFIYLLSAFKVLEESRPSWRLLWYIYLVWYKNNTFHTFEYWNSHAKGSANNSHCKFDRHFFLDFVISNNATYLYKDNENFIDNQNNLASIDIFFFIFWFFYDAVKDIF